MMSGTLAEELNRVRFNVCILREIETTGPDSKVLGFINDNLDVPIEDGMIRVVNRFANESKSEIIAIAKTLFINGIVKRKDIQND